MAKLMKIQALAVVSESVQGTAAAPSATDFFYAWNVSIKPTVEHLERDFTRNYLDTLPSLIGAVSYDLTFKTELKWSGNTGSKYTPMSALLEAVGFSGSLNASTWSYAQISSAPSANFLGASKSVTFVLVTDGLVNQLNGAVGTMKIVEDAHKIPELEFSFKGLFTAMTDSASMPTQTINELASYPVQLGTLNISGSTSLIASKIEVDCGNQIAMIDDVSSANGIKGFSITGRKPVGSFDPLGVSVATHDFLGKVVAGATFVGSFQNGSTPGNTVKVNFANMQYRDWSMVSKNEQLAFQIPLAFHGTSEGNNSIQISFS